MIDKTTSLSLYLAALLLVSTAVAQVCGQAADDPSFAPGVARLDAREFHKHTDRSSMVKFMAAVQSPEVRGRYEMNLLVDADRKVKQVRFLSGPEEGREKITANIGLIEVSSKIEDPVVGRFCYEVTARDISAP